MLGFPRAMAFDRMCEDCEVPFPLAWDGRCFMVKVVVCGLRIWDEAYHFQLMPCGHCGGGISVSCNTRNVTCLVTQWDELVFATCTHDINLVLERDHPVQLCQMMLSSTLNMCRRYELWWFKNATWNMLRIKLHSITIGLLKGRPEYSSVLRPERENDAVLKPGEVPEAVSEVGIRGMAGVASN
jgi:hypothetical protein